MRHVQLDSIFAAFGSDPASPKAATEAVAVVEAVAQSVVNSSPEGERQGEPDEFYNAPILSFVVAESVPPSSPKPVQSVESKGSFFKNYLRFHLFLLRFCF